MAFDVRVQNVLEKNTWSDNPWCTGVKNPGLTDRGVATEVTKFRMASGGLRKLAGSLWEEESLYLVSKWG